MRILAVLPFFAVTAEAVFVISNDIHDIGAQTIKFVLMFLGVKHEIGVDEFEFLKKHSVVLEHLVEDLFE